MRHRIIAALAVVMVASTGASQGGEISEQGARDLRGTLTHFLSRDLADSGTGTRGATGKRVWNVLKF